MRKKNHVHRTAQWCLIAASLFLFGTARETPGSIPVQTIAAHQAVSGKNELTRILSVLEAKEGDPRVLKKAIEKIRGLNERQLRLLSSLCDRIAAAEGTAGADIAFSLIAALIVLS